MVSITDKNYSIKEDKINVWTHIIGAFLSLVGLIVLLNKGLKYQDSLHVFIYLLYGLCMVFQFTASALYHGTIKTDRRLKFKTIDHIAIYILIAGTYTPYTILAINNPVGKSIFFVVWFIAIAGIILKIFFTGRFKILSTLSYVLMGWMIVFATKELLNTFPTEFLYWIMAGGAFYSLGAIIYSIKRIPYNHAIFHVLVLMGCYCLFVPVWKFI